MMGNIPIQRTKRKCNARDMYTLTPSIRKTKKIKNKTNSDSLYQYITGLMITTTRKSTPLFMNKKIESGRFPTKILILLHSISGRNRSEVIGKRPINFRWKYCFRIQTISGAFLAETARIF